MPAPPRMTIWSFLRFCLKWNLLLILVAVVSLVLAQTGHPFLPLLPPVVCGALFWRDAARISRALQGRIVRRVGGNVERRRSLKAMIVAAVATLAPGYLLVFHGHYAVLILLAVGAVAGLLPPFAVRRSPWLVRAGSPRGALSPAAVRRRAVSRLGRSSRPRLNIRAFHAIRAGAFPAKGTPVRHRRCDQCNESRA